MRELAAEHGSADQDRDRQAEDHCPDRGPDADLPAGSGRETGSASCRDAGSHRLVADQPGGRKPNAAKTARPSALVSQLSKASAAG